MVIGISKEDGTCPYASRWPIEVFVPDHKSTQARRMDEVLPLL